jgi:hypothetical protein
VIRDIVTVDCAAITDWPSFHGVFATAFGFPEFYGRNMDAWIDCMSSLDNPEDGMSQVHCGPAGVLTLHLTNVKSFKLRCPGQYAALIECSAFVNWRRNQNEEASVLAISFHE